MERTLILVKPDAFARGLTGEIIARFERKGLRLVGLKQMTMDRALGEQHYAEHEGKAFFGKLSAEHASEYVKKVGALDFPAKQRDDEEARIQYTGGLSEDTGEGSLAE